MTSHQNEDVELFNDLGNDGYNIMLNGNTSLQNKSIPLLKRYTCVDISTCKKESNFPQIDATALGLTVEKTFNG